LDARLPNFADSETLIVNGGSTTFAFASSLAARRDLTIVTNNVPMLSLISPEVVRDILLLGGTYRLDLASTVGWVGFQSGKISVDTAVLGVSGISVKSGISTTFFEEASMLAQMIDCARRTIVLADGSKFGIGAFANRALGSH
jgi:DeoR family transcriptional regulator, fructose operon transcriptional repressor